MTPRRFLRSALAGPVLVLALAHSAWAQSPPETDGGRPWWLDAALVGGAVGLTMTVDDETRDHVLEHRTEDWETFADVVRPFGEWVVYVPVGVGLTAAGWLAGDEAVLRAGERASLSIAVSAVFEGAAKYTFSRRRPASAENSRDFEFFSTHSSFPSGHTTVAFALAKSLSDDIDRRWATCGLYAVAAASAWARLIDDMHWASDLVAGAAVGYTSAVLVRSRILGPARTGLHATLTPAGPGLAWNF